MLRNAPLGVPIAPGLRLSKLYPRKKTAGNTVATIVIWMPGRSPVNIPVGTLLTLHNNLLAGKSSRDRFGESIPSDSSSSGRHRKNSYHHALWAFRVPVYVLRATQRRANISAVHRRGSQRPGFLLRIYRWRDSRPRLGLARAAPAYIVPAYRVRCLAKSSHMCFRRDGSDFPWLHSVSCRYSATGRETCSDKG